MKALPVSAEQVFPKTPWSLVAKSMECREQFAELLAIYRAPLAVFTMRKLGLGAHEAEDAVSELYAALLDRDCPLLQVHPAKGKFRSWLATCLENEVRGTWRRAGAVKRGGGAEHVAIDGPGGSGAALADGADDPATAFDRAFAEAVWARAVQRFLDQSGPEDSFEGRVGRSALKRDPDGDEALAVLFSTSVRSVTRERGLARKRFRRLLESELACVVETPEDMREELAWLLEMLAGKL